jgi:hypothetical protein
VKPEPVTETGTPTLALVGLRIIPALTVNVTLAVKTPSVATIWVAWLVPAGTLKEALKLP